MLQDVGNSDDGIHVSIFIDGNHQTYFTRAVGEAAQGYQGYGGYLPVQGSASYLLSANSLLDIRVHYGGGGDGFGVYGNTDWSHFSGYLIG